MTRDERWGIGRIALFWAPLAATWLMMAAEGPYLAAVIARLPDAKFNLAAFGVALSFAMLCESPIVMVLSAATALVHDRQSLLALRRFVWVLNAAITLALLVLVSPPVFRLIVGRAIGLPPEVASLTRNAILILLPWPAAIGYRRFYQGILIRHRLTRRVAYGTVVRLATMSLVGFGLFALAVMPGALVGAAALSAAVVLEAAASRVMARRAVRVLLDSPAADTAPLTTAGIARFYFPLALTSLITFGVTPLITFFLGRSRMALESLAVLPVVSSLVFILRAPGVAFQEVGIALLDGTRERFDRLRRFASILGACTAAALALIAFTPLAHIWFHRVSGLSLELTGMTSLPVRILCLMPALEVVLSFQRATLVHARSTAPITVASSAEVGLIVVILLVALRAFDLVGIVGAAVALLCGRCAANLFLAGVRRRLAAARCPAG